MRPLPFRVEVDDGALVEQVGPFGASKYRDPRIPPVLRREEVLRQVPLGLEPLLAQGAEVRPFRF